jgi:hypothetical protein
VRQLPDRGREEDKEREHGRADEARKMRVGLQMMY